MPACAGIASTAAGRGARTTVTNPFGILAEKAFEHRRINPETAAKYHVYTGRAEREYGPVTPDPNGNVIVFPFIDGGRDVGEKYRAKDKQFWQRKGGRRTFWNADVLDDPALHEGRAALIITEGEIDALSAIDCGFPFTVSVPDGASPVPKGKAPEDLEPLDLSQDGESKFEFMWNNRDRLKKIKRYVLAVDNDGPGQRLAAELKRRLLAAKCSFVTYPEGCKDLNDVLRKHGPERVSAVINGAQPYPVRGVYRLKDYPEQGELEKYQVGFAGWQHKLRVFPGEFIVVSGIPGHGKSSWVMNLVSNLASQYNWTAAICSPEMPTVPQMRDKLRRLWIGRKPILGEPAELKRADDWIGRRFVFIDIDPTGTGDNDEPFDLDWVIERATDAVMRDGIRILVIDPWNEIEHARGRNENSADYISRGIRALKRFAGLYGVIVIVVAHPTKEVGRDGKHRLVTLYDIEGAAAWFNKADHGIVVERKEFESVVHVQKVRFEETGTKGSYSMKYSKDSGRFEPNDLEQAP